MKKVLIIAAAFLVLGFAAVHVMTDPSNYVENPCPHAAQQKAVLRLWARPKSALFSSIRKVADATFFATHRNVLALVPKAALLWSRCGALPLLLTAQAVLYSRLSIGEARAAPY